MIKYYIQTNSDDYCLYLANKLRVLLSKYEYDPVNFDYLFVIGGDGSIIRACQKYHDTNNVKIIGINCGKVGFFASFDENNLDDIPALLELNDHKSFSSYSLIRYQWNNITNYCFNDIYISGNKVIDVDIYINDTLLQTYRGSGLLFSSMNGSTGFNKSASGPLILSNDHLWVMNEVNPQSTNKFNTIRNPLVLDDYVNVQIKNVNDNHLNLTGDGVSINLSDQIDLITLKLIESSCSLYISNSIENRVKRIRDIFLI